MYLYNKNVLEYAQIARNEMESKIPYIEGRSNVYIRYRYRETASIVTGFLCLWAEPLSRAKERQLGPA